jgi:hypothetical protein
VSGLLAIASFLSGDREALRQPLTHLVPLARADVTPLRPNSCESCHTGLRAVEEIHPLFALRCVDCHGGDETNFTKDGAHVARPGNFGVTNDAKNSPASGPNAVAPTQFPQPSATHPISPPAQTKEQRYFPVFRSELSVGGDDPDKVDQRNATFLAYRRFKNPGDLLVADQACGASGCHGPIVDATKRSLHSTIAGIMNLVYYANGHPGASAGGPGDFKGTDADKLAKLAAVLPNGGPLVDPNFDPARLGTVPSINLEVPRNDQSLRDVTKGGKKSNQLGALAFTVQTDCVRCHSWTQGSPSPGEWHSAGCTSCHVVYTSEAALSESVDPTTPKRETNHPQKHLMVRFPPTEQCAHCHNRGARVTQRFLGMRDAPQPFTGLPEFRLADEHGENTPGLTTSSGGGAQPDRATGGLIGGFFPGRLLADQTTTRGGPLFFKPNDVLFGRPYNPGAVAGQGNALVRNFINQAVWRRFIFPIPGITKGNPPLFTPGFPSPFYITDENRENGFDETPPDLHAERGLGCVDCHTSKESHGDGHIYSSKPHAVEVTCEMCHGSSFEVANFKTRFGDDFPGLFRDQNGRPFQRLKSTGEVRPLVQIKEILDRGQNQNALGPSHVLHGRLECWTCHATWHAQQFSRTSLIDYNTDVFTGDKPLFGRRGYNDNELRNAFQAGGEASFVTSADELILGINHKGKIQNFDPAGLDFLWANKVAAPGANPADGNFLELNRCAGGINDRQLCEVDSECPGGTCPKFTCQTGPFAGMAAQSEGQCGQCTKTGSAVIGDFCVANADCGAGGTCNGTTNLCTAVGPLFRNSPEDLVFNPNRIGPSCTLDTDCGLAANSPVPPTLPPTDPRVGVCAVGTLGPRVCYGGSNNGKSCTWDPKNPTAESGPNGACPGGTCGVRMVNFAYTTIDGNQHLPSFSMQPLFPHTVRKIPRNCDSCHPSLGVGSPFPSFGPPSNLDLVIKAIGWGTGTSRVTDPADPRGFRDLNVSRQVRIFTNGKGQLSIANENGGSINDGDLVSINLDEFIRADVTLDRGRIKVTNVHKTRPTPHVGTGPLDSAAIEKILNTWVSPQIPSQPGP